MGGRLFDGFPVVARRTITITVAPTGQVSATIEGALAGSEGARCLENFFESAELACFTGEPVKLRKSITLE